jgi:hypothetical protein
VLDEMTEDAVAMTVESDGKGGLYPVAYVRRDGALSEHALPADPLLDFATEKHRAELAGAVARLIAVVQSRT